MEKLQVLEQKISSLIEVAQKLKKENAQLVENSAQLAAKLAAMEKSLMGDNERIEEFDKERKLTKTIVDDLIRSIDSLVENEKQK